MNAIAYVGWLKDGERWRQVAEAPTEAACWRLLLDVPSDQRNRERAVLPAGKDPNHQRRPR